MTTQPYTGPLADRRIEGVDLHFAALVCPFAAKGPDAERIAALAEALEAAPIVVRAPRSDTLGYGLTGGGGRVRLVRFNTALIDAALAFERSGQYPAGEDDASVLGATRFTPKTLPDGAAALRWGLAALASLGVGHPPFGYFAGDPTVPDFEALLAAWDASPEGYDPAAARALLDEWAAAPKLTQPRPLPLAEYDGPLAARRIPSAPEGGSVCYSWLTRGTKQDALTRGLRHHPLHVRAPGQKYIVWTLRADPIGSPSIELVVQNTAAPHGGGHDDVGDLGAAMAWAFAVVDHYGLPEAPVLVPARCDRASLIGFHRRHGVQPIRWDRIAEALRRSGAPVPADLLAQPPLIEGTHARAPDAERLRMRAGIRPEDGMPLDGIPSDDIDTFANDGCANYDFGADHFDGHPLFEPRAPEQRWTAGPALALSPDDIDDWPKRLRQHPGPIALAGLADWSEVALEDARFLLSREPLSRPATLDGSPMTLDALLDRLVAALDTADSPARRVRPEGMSPTETERVVAIMYADTGRGRFYVDRVRDPMTEDALYDIFDESLFAPFEEP